MKNRIIFLVSLFSSQLAFANDYGAWQTCGGTSLFKADKEQAASISFGNAISESYKKSVSAEETFEKAHQNVVSLSNQLSNLTANGTTFGRNQQSDGSSVVGAASIRTEVSRVHAQLKEAQDSERSASQQVKQAALEAAATSQAAETSSYNIATMIFSAYCQGQGRTALEASVQDQIRQDAQKTVAAMAARGLVSSDPQAMASLEERIVNRVFVPTDDGRAGAPGSADHMVNSLSSALASPDIAVHCAAQAGVAAVFDAMGYSDIAENLIAKSDVERLAKISQRDVAKRP